MRPNGWTGGQHSLLRVACAAALALRIAVGSGWSGAEAFQSVAALLAGIWLAVGIRERLGALTFVALALLTRDPAAGAVAGWFALAPERAYGSLDAVGRTDPRGEPDAWQRQPWLHALAGIAAGLVLVITGEPAPAPAPALAATAAVVFLISGLGLRYAWYAGAAICGTIVFLTGDPFPLVTLFLAWDPALVPARRVAEGAAPDVMLHDAGCGVCQRAVRFLLAEDREEQLFVAPLFGATWDERVDDDVKDTLPDSVILVDDRGRLRVRSAALIALGARLGGTWRVLAVVASIIPRVVRDAFYDGFAAIRHRLFAKPKEACPILPPDLRRRFLA